MLSRSVDRVLDEDSRLLDRVSVRTAIFVTAATSFLLWSGFVAVLSLLRHL
jgi:hypothetical protein